MAEEPPADKPAMPGAQPTPGGNPPEWRPLSERPAARPLKPGGDASEPASDQPAASATANVSQSKGWLFGLGCLPLTGIGIGFAILVVLIYSIAGGFTSTSTIQACLDAQNARSISDSAESASDRDIAALQYAVKKAECEAAGGTVP